MKSRVKHLVVDSGGFIRNSPVHEYAENIYSVDGAVKEIRDKATKERLQVLPYELRLKAPFPENYKYVAEFSKKTGDYGSLSAVDLQIIALTYQLEKELVGTDHLNVEPTCQVSGKFSSVGQMQGFYSPKNEQKDVSVDENCKDLSEDSELVEDCILAENSEATQAVSQEEVREEEVSNAEEENNEEDSWITPANLTEIQKKMGNCTLDDETDITVACITTDFAVQNVLLQMGLHVVSVDGFLVKNTRVFIFRCFGCFKTTSDMTKTFCPSCGNKTLKRVSVSVTDDGSKRIFVNFKRPINVRGMKYSLPTPKGGKHAVNPVLCEDQPIPHNRQPKSGLSKIDVLSSDFIASGSPFAFHDVYSRASGLGVDKKFSHMNRRKNPNEYSVRTGNRKK